MNAGHYIAKAACNIEYYFDDRNVNAQCAGCNLRLEGNRPAYREFIIRKYGQGVLAELETQYGSTFNGDTHMWLLDKIDDYKIKATE